MKRLKQAQLIDPLMKPREHKDEPVLSRTPHAPEMDASKFWMQRKFNKRTGTWVWIPFLLLAVGLSVPREAKADTNCPTVSFGASNDAVLEAQYRLRSFGYVLGVDGKFGPRTLKVIQTFQRQNGLLPDGIVGPITQRALGCGVASNGLAPAVRLNPPAGVRDLVNALPYRINDPNPAMQAFQLVAVEAGWDQAKIESWATFLQRTMAIESRFCPNIRSGAQFINGGMGGPNGECTLSHQGSGDASGFGQFTWRYYYKSDQFFCTQHGVCSAAQIVGEPYVSMQTVIWSIDERGSQPWCYRGSVHVSNGDCSTAP